MIRRFEFTLNLPLDLLETDGEVATLVLTVDLVVPVVVVLGVLVEIIVTVLSAAVVVVVVVVDGGTYGANS